MKEERTCKIIQDLLPNYIEKLTNEETNEFIEAHLKGCNECEEILKNMQKDMEINYLKREEKKVEYMKKFSNKMKTLKSILLIIIIIYFLIVARRTMIMVSLSEKAKENIINTNYYAKLYSYQGDSLTITETFNNGEDYLTTMNYYSDSSLSRKLIFYQKGNERICLSEYEGQTYLLDENSAVGGHVSPVTYVSEGLLGNLQYAFFIGIDSTYCNGRECYVIKGDSYERYIDKETGLAIRCIEKSNKDITRKTDSIVDYEYKYDIVKDSDIIKPDISENIINNKI